MGFLLGKLLIFLVQPPERLHQHIKAGCMVGNTSNLPLVLIAAVAADAEDVFGPSERSFGVAYVAVSFVRLGYAGGFGKGLH